MMLRTNARAFLGACSSFRGQRLLSKFSSVSRNYYSVLGVTPNADSQEIREAYKRLAKEYHPSLFAQEAQAVGAG